MYSVYMPSKNSCSVSFLMKDPNPIGHIAKFLRHANWTELGATTEKVLEPMLKKLGDEEYLLEYAFYAESKPATKVFYDLASQFPGVDCEVYLSDADKDDVVYSFLDRKSYWEEGDEFI